jgi:hypothetical protein
MTASAWLAFGPRDYLPRIHARLDNLERHIAADGLDLTRVIHHALATEYPLADCIALGLKSVLNFALGDWFVSR